MSILSSALWHLIAWLATRPRIALWLMQRAQRTPYTHITSADGQHLYMGRWWLFNPYGRGEDGEQTPASFPGLPSVRIHHICRADQDRDLHDHPWNARTIILRGWYREERPRSACGHADMVGHCIEVYRPRTTYPSGAVRILPARAVLHRPTGHTGRLLFGEYHRISEVSPGGVWTLFITGRKRGTWGFDVQGNKVPWRQYLGLDKPTQPSSEPRA